MDSQLTQLAKSDRNPAQETQYKQLLAQSGQPYFQGGNGTQSSAMPWNSGGGASNGNVTDALNKQQTGFNDLLSSSKQSVTDALGKYSTDMGNAVTNANNTFKIPQQVGTVNALNNRINDLQFNTGNTGQGGYSSSGQVDAALNSRYLPAQNTAISNLNTSEGAAQNQIAQATAPDVKGIDALTSYIATAMSGFGANESAQLNTLIGQLNAGVTLTTTQMDTANKLAVAQLAYDQAVKTEQIKQSVQTLSPGQLLYGVGTDANGNPSSVKIAGNSNPVVKV